MIIGIMGGIGSGKSTVLNYLSSTYGAQIIQSDLVAKEIMLPGNKVFDLIAKDFPEAIEDSKINSAKLSSIVFNDEQKLKKLNDITHPGTIMEIKNRITDSKSDMIIVESALLLGTELEHICDELWFVFCEKEIRISRLMNDRMYSREKALNIINNQVSDEEFNLKADEFIDNSDSELKTREQIDIIVGQNFCS